MSCWSFSAPLPTKQLFCGQLPLTKTFVFFQSNELLSPKALNLDGCFSSENPTMIRVTLLCGRALSERALGLLLNREGGTAKMRLWTRIRRNGQETAKDPKVEGSRSDQSSVTPPQRYESSQNTCFTVFRCNQMSG